MTSIVSIMFLYYILEYFVPCLYINSETWLPLLVLCYISIIQSPDFPLAFLSTSLNCGLFLLCVLILFQRPDFPPRFLRLPGCQKERNSSPCIFRKFLSVGISWRRLFTAWIRHEYSFVVYKAYTSVELNGIDTCVK